MTQPGPVQAGPVRTSLVIVSRHRPEALARCLAAVAQLDHAAFELIVVADPAALAAVTLPAKTLAFDLPNISAARNAGLALAAGDIVAFLDDDAVPEPSWLRHLTAPFANPKVVAAGGFVRGRNGISFQWKASQTNSLGEATPLAVDEVSPSLHPVGSGQAVRTEGTNCAFRIDALAAIGGFDPAFRFYLDETDVNMRLARSGYLTAIVPLAQVVHGFAASAQRHANRAPKTLFDIGASSAVFWRKHADPAAEPAARARLIAAQRTRLLRHMVTGTLEPRDVPRLLATLEAGLIEGAARPLGHLSPLHLKPPPFLPFPASRRPGMVLAGRPWQARRLREKARRAVADGAVVTLFVFSPGLRRHQHRFDAAGYWEQRGGLWGRARRDTPARFGGFAARLAAERLRIAPLRPVATPDPGPGNENH